MPFWFVVCFAAAVMDSHRSSEADRCGSEVDWRDGAA